MLLEGNLKELQYVGIPVRDLEVARRWYIDTLGFSPKQEFSLTAPEGETRAAFLERFGLVVKLYEQTASQWEHNPNNTDGHIDHFAMDALDVRKGITDLQVRGAQIDPDTKDGPVLLAEVFPQGAEYVFFRGPSGERFELNERRDLDRNRRQENLGGWAHLGIPVVDVDKSVAFYAQFGFKTIMEAIVPVGDGLVVKITIVEKGGLYLEFYQLPDAALPEIASRSDGFVDHVAVSVEDCQAAFEELAADGISPLEDAPLSLPFWNNGERYFTFRGPDGEKIELHERL